MPFEKGHQLSKGVGRPSAYQENANREWLAMVFFKTHSEKELLRLAKEKSIANTIVKKAIGGDKTFTMAIFNKLFPDINPSPTFNQNIIAITPERERELLNKFKRDNTSTNQRAEGTNEGGEEASMQT